MGFDPSSVVADYGDPAAESLACRTDAALFDFSFMSRAIIEGAGAIDALSQITSRHLADQPIGRIRYALREAPDGHVVADLTIWRIAPEIWEVMSGRPEDIADLAAVARRVGNVTVLDLTAETSIFALQGPQSYSLIRSLLEPEHAQRLTALPYYATTDVALQGVPVRVGRLGYTGEQGVELVLPTSSAEAIWNTLAAKARPAGFVAADMLRIEAGFVLFANEFRLPVTAAEAGLAGFAPAPNAHDQQTLRLASFRALSDRDVTLFRPRDDASRPADPGVLAPTSACISRAAGGILGLGYVLASHDPSNALRDPSDTFQQIELVNRPYYDPGKTRPRGPWT